MTERVTLASSPSQSKPVGFARLPLLSLRDIFPRRGGSLSSKGEPLAVHASFISLPRALPLGELSPQVTERARPLAGHLLKFSLPCNHSARSTVCSAEKRSEFCPGHGEEKGHTACFYPADLCFLQILTQLSQKNRRTAIESTRRACIIGMLRTHCPAKREELLRRVARQRNGRRRWKNSV